VLGERFATDWAKDPRRALVIKGPQGAPWSGSAVEKPKQRVVLVGRSIIYGALLYVGALSGGMWVPIILQSLIGVCLVFLFTVRVTGLGFPSFLITHVFLLLASPLPFCVSFLMPDVFAGFLILGFAILALGWYQLSILERAFTSAVLLFAVLFHPTHLLLLILLTVLGTGYILWLDRARWPHFRNLVGIAAACVVLALLWEAAFALGVTRVLGTAPVRPPFLTARLVASLGEPAVSRVCMSREFVVCSFQNRFPIDTDTFLWSDDKNRGVFNIADTQTKYALDREQMRFATAIIPSNLSQFAFNVLNDSLHQLTAVGLDEYWYSGEGLVFFQDRLPRQDFERMSSTLAARSRGYILFGRIVLYVSAALSAVAILALLGGALRPGFTSESLIEKARNWRSATYILLAGILLNAPICAGLSAVNNRYETRVIWLIQLSMATGVLSIWPSSKFALFPARTLEENIAAFRQ
jgi:hypothetical protein